MNDLNLDPEFRRLLDLYADKADEELLELHDRRQDLTELAQQALAQTMQQRGLEPVEAETPRPPAASAGELAIGQGEGQELAEDELALITFRDALEATQAIETLREAEIPHRITDRKIRYTSGDSRDLLELVVSRQDADRAREVLQRTLGLFPPPEGDEEHGEDDLLPLGQFTAEQARVVIAALEGAAIPHTSEAEADAAPDEPLWIYIPAPRIDEAFDLMERIADTLPGEDE